MHSARRTACRILDRIERENAFAAAVIEAEIPAINDPRDAALCNELVLGVLRRRSWLDELLRRAARRGALDIDAVILTILRVAAYQICFLDRVPDHAAVSEAVDMARATSSPGLASLVNALLRAIGRMSDSEKLPPPLASLSHPDELALASGLPSWVIHRLIADHGLSLARDIAAAFNRPSRRFMRINLNRISRAELLHRDPELSIEDLRLPWSVEALNRDAARRLEDEGLAAFQDEGSGLVVAALGDLEHCSVLDACAGRGGKTGTIAMQMHGTGSLLATDRKKNKLERLRFDFERQQLSATTRVMDVRQMPAAEDIACDRVLIDAPCSGSGTMGRRPEIRWRLQESDVKALEQIQTDMLDRLAAATAPGGRMVFATCSVFAAEHTHHVQAFLAHHPDFRPVTDPPRLWPSDIPWNNGAPFVDPSKTGTDGYGILCFSRSGN